MWLSEKPTCFLSQRCFRQQIFVICPSTVQFNYPGFKLKEQFYPHLSMEDPPDLKSLFQLIPERSARCTNNNHVSRNQDSALRQGYCKRDRKETLGNEWRLPNWELVSDWVSSELALNLYQYDNGYGNSSMNF